MTSAEALRDSMGKEFEAIRQYIKQLEAAGIGDDDPRLKRARERRVEAQRRYYACVARTNDLLINAAFGQNRPIYDTVAAYVGPAHPEAG